MINEQSIKKYLKIPLAVKILEQTESTNSDARKLTENPDFDETLIIAKEQTNGRGRMGRSFFSPSGGLYMSLLLKPDFSADKTVHITTAAAVSVIRAISKVFKIESSIKWVNDIYFRDKKVCGILTEAKISSLGKTDFAILGIGINITKPVGGFPKEIENIAGELISQIHNDEDCRLAAEIVNEFYSLYKRGLCSDDYIEEYRLHSFILGKSISVTKIINGESRIATAINIDDNFRLTVRYDDGSFETLESGEVTINANGK